MPTVSVTISNKFINTGHKDNSIVQIPVDGILFDELSNAGFIMSSGCLAGACGVCAAFILKGQDNLKPPSSVEQDTIAHIAGQYLSSIGVEAPYPIRLLCRAKIRGNIVIAPFAIKNQ